jgi:hypothetical protein
LTLTMNRVTQFVNYCREQRLQKEKEASESKKRT